MALTTLAIAESIHIAAAPETVWRFLADPSNEVRPEVLHEAPARP